MKKMILGIAVVVAIIAASIGIIYADEDTKNIERCEKVLENLEAATGYESLGVIDGRAISERNGLLYDGPGIKKELFERKGYSTPENTWEFYVSEFSGVRVYKIVVYKGERKQPIFEQEIEKIYIYGLYY